MSGIGISMDAQALMGSLFGRMSIQSDQRWTTILDVKILPAVLLLLSLSSTWYP